MTRREEKPKITFNRNQLLEKLRTDVAENGEQYISELFSRANIVDAKRLISCLTIHYTFTEEEATQLVDHLAKFDKIKLDTLKEYLYKPTPLEKGESKAKSKEKPDKNDKNRSGGGKEGGSGWKGEGEGKEEREGKGKGEREGKRIGDPRRQKINIPLVK